MASPLRPRSNQCHPRTIAPNDRFDRFHTGASIWPPAWPAGLAVPPIPRKSSRSVPSTDPKLVMRRQETCCASMCVSGNADEPRPTAPPPKWSPMLKVLRRGKNVALPEGYERDFKPAAGSRRARAVGRHPFRFQLALDASIFPR